MSSGRQQRPARRLFPAAAAAGLLALPAAPARAQASGDGFLFGRPQATLTVRGGYDQPAATGDVFSFLTDQLTLGRGAFGGPAAHAEFALTLTRRVDLALFGGIAGSSRGSEFRRFTENGPNGERLPITQTTALRRVPLGVGLKVYLTPRGREIGEFAFLPARLTPFAGVGAGVVWYRLRQQGSFVDDRTLNVFNDQLSSSGFAPAGYASAGAEYSLSPRLALSGELRYTQARSTAASGSFIDVGNVNLSGAAGSVGLAIRF